MMNKRFLSLTSAVALMIPLIANAMGIQVIIDGKTVTFADVPQSAWFAADVRAAAEAGIVNGYKDRRGMLTGKYGPANDITIGEALKIAVEGAGYDEDLYASKIQSGFQHWASPYVSVAKGEGFLVIDARTRLDKAATRSEVAAIFTSAFHVNMESVQLDTRYDDVSAGTEFASSIEALSRDKVVSGDTDIDGQAVGTFRPTQNINRAEVAKIVMQARAAYGTPGLGRTPSEEQGGGTENEQNIVTYTDEGFSPLILRIKKGDTVTFKNDSTTGLWVASNPHPTHTSLPGFDADHTLINGETYMYTFTQIGSWGFHNHLNSRFQGTIVVE